MSKPHSKSRFQESWFGNPKYSLWVSKDGSNPSKALCKLCQKAIDLKSGGSFALDSYKKGQKHHELEKARKTNAMGCLYPLSLQHQQKKDLFHHNLLRTPRKFDQRNKSNFLPLL